MPIPTQFSYWTLLRLPAVLDQSGHRRSALYDQIAQRLWTRSVAIGPRAVAWPAGEVAALNAARIAGKSNDEIRELVAKLEAARKDAFKEAN